MFWIRNVLISTFFALFFTFIPVWAEEALPPLPENVEKLLDFKEGKLVETYILSESPPVGRIIWWTEFGIVMYDVLLVVDKGKLIYPDNLDQYSIMAMYHFPERKTDKKGIWLNVPLMQKLSRDREDEVGRETKTKI